jgi:hypothetical protein
MINAETKVKSIYPDAELGYGLVTPKTKWVWSTSNNLYHRELFTMGIWISQECLVYGGKDEFKLWQRAWKEIQKNMLRKLEG